MNGRASLRASTASSTLLVEQLDDAIVGAQRSPSCASPHFGGDMEAAIAPVADIIEETVRGFHETIGKLTRLTTAGGRAVYDRTNAQRVCA